MNSRISQILYSKPILLFFLIVFIQPLHAQDRPNVLLIISDDLNTDIGPYMDIKNHTPNLDRLADEGVSFTRAYSQYPVCGPSRSSLMSGLYPETNGVTDNGFKGVSYRQLNPDLSDHPTIAGFFREQGYYTARVSKIFHMGVPGGIERGSAGDDDPDSWDYAYNVMGPETVSDGKLEQLSPMNDHYGGNFSRMILPNDLAHTQTDYLAASQAIAILENRVGKIPENATQRLRLKTDSPFFLAVGFVRPHVPLIAPERDFKPYPEQEMELPAVKVGENVPEEALRRQNDNVFGMSDTQKKQVISAYMASVRFMDAQVGRLLDALDRLEVRDETIVIFVSDHGYNLGEHDTWSKISLWEGSIRVPLIFSVPGDDFESNYGTESDIITELIDLYPTLTDLANFSDQSPEILQGKSLLDHIKGNPQSSNGDIAYTISYQGNAASIRTDRWRYTRWGEEIEDDNEELYDHHNDPEEHVNLADHSNHQEILEKLRELFDKKRRLAQESPF
ncbi:sulfatase [Rhodohalobacter sulfatireducens]|uniref:Sulfatase n=1 Tax=Rhodohalobacter sulfatireducens TaxID=2911366 RepID=A0ABS9KGV6_9BACT|nr:sulfatase [Rhodohalobacter sulfatireducens]MCG2590094.1 sulfatase [Rhodohalobacter sulfatireducens]